MQEQMTADIYSSGLFTTLDPNSFGADLAKEELSIGPDSWRTVGAEGVVQARTTNTGGDVSVEFRLFEVIKGDRPVLTKTYRAPSANIRRLAHIFADEIVRYYTGEDSFFGTQIAFSRPIGRQQELVIMDYDGAGQHSITSNGSSPCTQTSAGRRLSSAASSASGRTCMMNGVRANAAGGARLSAPAPVPPPGPRPAAAAVAAPDRSASRGT